MRLAACWLPSGALEARASEPMRAAGAIAAGPPSGRVFVCARCQAEVLICSDCDRGQRYCGSECSAQARRVGQREAGRRYQSSRAGRFAHARRARGYRQRRRQQQQPPSTSTSTSTSPKIVTHQCSQEPCAGDVLRPKLDVGRQATGCEAEPRVVCRWCARACHSVVRRGFLRHGPILRHLAHCMLPIGSRRGTPHGSLLR